MAGYHGLTEVEKTCLLTCIFRCVQAAPGNQNSRYRRRSRWMPGLLNGVSVCHKSGAPISSLTNKMKDFSVGLNKIIISAVFSSYQLK